MLRRYAFPEGIRRATDAQAMLELHRLCPAQADAWESYFIESLAAYIVDRGPAPGTIDEIKAAWLISAISEDGAVRTWLEIELLLHAMEIARSTSETLSAFALDQIRMALLPGGGTAYADKRPDHPGVTVFDLAYIWRVLRPAVDGGRMRLSPLESIVLREIDDLAERDNHHPAWNEMVAHIAMSTSPVEKRLASRWLHIVEPVQEDCAA